MDFTWYPLPGRGQTEATEIGPFIRGWITNAPFLLETEFQSLDNPNEGDLNMVLTLKSTYGVLGG